MHRLRQRIGGKPETTVKTQSKASGLPPPMARHHTAVSIEEWTNICITSQVVPVGVESDISQSSTAVHMVDLEHFEMPKSFSDVLDKV